MEIEKTNKVTEMAKKTGKSNARGEKCLAKFTAANGNVYGSLTLDIRKAGDYSQPLPVAVRVCHSGQKIFLRLGKSYTMEEWLVLCDYEKSGRRIQLAERNDMKNLMDRVEQMANQLISENLTSSTCHPKFICEQWSDTLIPFHKHSLIDSLLALRQCNLYSHYSFSKFEHLVHTHIYAG